MTAFVAAYDTEKPEACLESCKRIARVHRDVGAPGTFFIVGKLLEEQGKKFCDLLDEPDLFEIASHTYSHKLLRDNAVCGRAVPPEVAHAEIVRSKQLVEEVFERPCLGLRPAVSFETGLSGAPELVEEVANAGYKYVSSRAWGPDCSLPAPLEQAYNYADEGHPEIWEFPCHGWHENVLKGHNAVPRRLLLWPPVYPELQQTRLVKTVEQEFEIHRFFLDRALTDNLEYVSLIWHPWSLMKFDPEMRMPRMVFEYARGQGMELVRFDDLWRRRAQH